MLILGAKKINTSCEIEIISNRKKKVEQTY